MRLLLNIYIWVSFIIITLLFFILLPVYLLFHFVFLRGPVDLAIRWAVVIYGWILVKIVPFLAPVIVESRGEKPPLPAILVANHNSAIDPYLFGALLINVSFITTWPFKIPVYGFCMRLARYIDANEGWEKVCQKSAALLRSGVSIIIWPEGHRSRDGSLGRFKNGAFALAVQTGFPILPVCILGSEKLLPPGKRLLSPSRIKLLLLDPIYPNPHNNQLEEIIRLRNQAYRVIKETLEEGRKQDYLFSFAKRIERGEEC
jgi:1-acyl-sn-glycerol-3-phosphate acyltransferase